MVKGGSRFFDGSWRKPTGVRVGSPPVRTLVLALAAAVLTGSASAAFRTGGIVAGKPIPVRILVDLSKSMYPGYRVESFHGPRRFVDEFPAFRKWFGGFVRSMMVFKASRVSVVGFASDSRRTPADAHVALGPDSPPDRFDEAAVFAGWRHTGLETDLDRNLRALTRDFEGLVFLVTDNRVETSTASETEATETFFRRIKESDRFQAVHIYRYDLQDPASGQTLSLAVYGLLVSPDRPDDSTALFFDNGFKTPGLVGLFQGRHLKLRPLDVKPVTLNVKFTTTNHGGTRFVENEPVQLLFEAWITNNTLFTLRRGKCAITVKGSFHPKDRRTQKEYGLEPLSNTLFKALPIDSIPEVAPGARRKLLRKIVLDTRGIPLKVTGLWNWLSKACGGLEVEYAGTGSITARDLEFALTREGFEKLAGIYGEESLRRVFRIDEKRLVPVARPDTFPISFRLKGDPRYGVLVAIILVLLALPLAVAAIILFKKASCRVRVGAAEHYLALRRFGSAPVTMGGLLLGCVSRGAGSTFSFRPAPPSPFFSIRTTADPGLFEVFPKDSPPVRLEVQAVSGSAALGRKPGPAAPGTGHTGFQQDGRH